MADLKPAPVPTAAQIEMAGGIEGLADKIAL